MSITVFEGYTVGKIERGIPFPNGSRRPLSIEQQRVLQMKEGDSFVLVVRFDGFSTDNARRLAQWARTKGIRIMQRKIDHDSVRIWRVGAMKSDTPDQPQK
ncbi:hypothetical protein GCM10008098_00490 [Rhodanobacter panaciterrae]|uniref:Uncharacterized protein n=1 Tax=Rhodanobacter panaciterrae TaxID=490572 RepID=A0ABQ2ZI14_9GAMM|nr:hypothetical protein [Rhodanobacter panaciterrae]GGY13771.1 hypothetical protein GCM10008098_00490 [Rhodanobacter panaciterrae]